MSRPPRGLPRPSRPAPQPTPWLTARTTPRLALPLALCLVLALVAGGCSADREPDARPDAEASTGSAEPTAPAPVATKVVLGTVVGKLPPKRRKALLRAVAPVVDGWLDAAYVGGAFPREVSGAYAGFTRDAARRARRDDRLTSGAALASRIDGVAVTKRAVRYNVLAAGGRPAGVTARITLDYLTTGEVERKVSVRGRLALTRARGGAGWQVFAYDLTRGDV